MSVISEVRHPAVFPVGLLTAAARLLDDEGVTSTGKMLDPFAGTGKGLKFMNTTRGNQVYGIELEPEWASRSDRVTVGSATCLPFGDNTFDVVFTSPCYGNRMADHHEARDSSRRNTYRHALGRPLGDGSAAGLQWGNQYRTLHLLAWEECYRVCVPGAAFLLNCKDHIRAGKIQGVTPWHINALSMVGFEFRFAERVRTAGNRQGANGALRVDGETLAFFRKPV